MNALLSTRNQKQNGAALNNLNMAKLPGDHLEKVQTNRERVSAALGLPRIPWHTCNQVHGVQISTIHQSGSECDGILLDESGKMAAIMLADCHPIVIYDPIRHIAALAHAGWRGTQANIAIHAVQAMQAQGSRIKDMYAATGPGIGPCCFTVQNDVAVQFMELFDAGDDVIEQAGPSGPWRISLENANYRLLINAGIPSAQIGRAGFCTACRGRDFFSYRKEGGSTGRYAALMFLR